MKLSLIKNANVFSPEALGVVDVLVGGGKILAIGESLSESFAGVTDVVDAGGAYVLPGLIDGHVHITGGGGEGGFKTRTPELTLTDCIEAGITTVVGVIGTDGTSRTMANLVAKAKGLTEEGITCYCQSGNYHIPVKTLTGSIQDDMMFVQEIIGAGEIAIADHRSSQPTVQELAKLASEARIGGMLSGKGGTVTIHIGDGKDELDLLEEVIETTVLPISQFWPTHINRNPSLVERGIAFAKRGGVVDLTTSCLEEEEEDELAPSKILAQMLREGVRADHVTFTSDGQGSLPSFHPDGSFKGLEVGRVTSLFKEVRDAFLVEGLDLETAWSVATTNVADVLKLEGKGKISLGYDADLLIVEPDSFEIESVMAKGVWLKLGGQQLVKGTFE
ncbi:beta-aspartyl-peptidase [Paenalkalicoccus suaedae]|uniref:Isoaspartyl dipeptidase n=1 Tax=Paenalkalicoccus suaedae TaxID=2592382 RepID=A0A859F9J7_9BACI|nr:beta-aspartyl-peptidase [Paenalkalicoccus suaedae]QKS69769.1 beta-aspartyl-peptidase [Paenalkalicoccus suaedae]